MFANTAAALEVMQVSHRSCTGLSHSSQQPQQQQTLRPRTGRGGSVPSDSLRAGIHSQPDHATICRVTNELLTVAGVSPTFMQDVLVGGAVFGTVGFALVAGLRKEPVVCELCQGNGGSRCFGCEGEGKMTKLISRDALMDASAKRDVLGRSMDARSCKVCKGAGLIACSKCRGSGYVNM